MNRNRWLFFSLTLIIILAGLNSRSGIVRPDSFLGKYAADTLWAMMVYFVLATIFLKTSIIKISFSGAAFSLLIEVSQLFRFDWLMALRSYKLGGLILGYGFLWSDLLCYVSGIGLAAGVDNIILVLSKESKTS